MVRPNPSSRLHQLFADVEKEFEALYVENAQLRNRVSLLEKGASGVHSNQYETDDRTAGSTVGKLRHSLIIQLHFGHSYRHLLTQTKTSLQNVWNGLKDSFIVF